MSDSEDCIVMRDVREAKQRYSFHLIRYYWENVAFPYSFLCVGEAGGGELENVNARCNRMVFCWDAYHSAARLASVMFILLCTQGGKKYNFLQENIKKI